MQYLTFGRTGLRVSKVGLGCGGHSRLGQNYGNSEADSVRVVRAAVDLGINYIDTATNYRTEPIVGKALTELKREELIISSKFSPRDVIDGSQPVETGVREAVDASLQRLGTEYIDVYHVHGLQPEHTEIALEQIVPVLQACREAGKIRHLAVSEMFGGDTDHRMYPAVADADVFDVFMVGFNVLNPSARKSVFPLTMKRGVGTEIMFAIRNVLYKPDRFRETVQSLIGEGSIDETVFGGADPVEFLFGKEDPEVMAEWSYRYAAWEPGADILLSGTGKVEHLKANISSILKGPLEPETKARFDAVFGNVDSVSGN